MPLLVIINNLLALKIVQWLLLSLTVALLIAATWLELKNKTLTATLKTAQADLAWTQSALSLQNDAVKKAGEEQKKLEAQKQTKAKEAEAAKATAAERAAEIMRLKLSKDCKEVTQWGLDQALSQSRW